MSDTTLDLTDKLQITCHVSPTQVEGEDSAGRHIYLRYRFGHCTVQIDNTTIYTHTLGDGLHGYLESGIAKRLCIAAVDFHDAPTPLARQILADATNEALAAVRQS